MPGKGKQAGMIKVIRQSTSAQLKQKADSRILLNKQVCYKYIYLSNTKFRNQCTNQVYFIVVAFYNLNFPLSIFLDSDLL